MNLRKGTRSIPSITCSFLTRAPLGFGVFLRGTEELYLSISWVIERYPVFKFLISLQDPKFFSEVGPLLSLKCYKRKDHRQPTAAK